MTVLVEGVSVIIKLEAIDRIIPDGWEGFRQYLPNFTLCKDDKLARFGFLNQEEAMEFRDKLQSLNFVYQGSEGAQDFVFVDQLYGPTTKCNWLECGHVEIQNDPEKKVAACQITGDSSDSVVTPEGWEYEHSLTAKYGLTPSQQG